MGRAFEFRKARKMKRWSAMSKVFSRLNKDIIIAIKDGGNADPDTNSTLRAVLQNCRAANMPKDNIARAIKKATDKDTSSYKEVTFEGYGAHGVAFFVETATDNNNRTVASVRSDFAHNGGNLGTTGSVEFLFNRVCFFNISSEGQDPEELELELIDYGAEEIEVDDLTIIITAPFESFGGLMKKLEELGLEIQESGFDRVPTTTSELGESETIEVEKLIDKLEENDDVQSVYHSMSSSSE
ncbi:MAG TPA: YebC/PmpR family DNA-binding transcriptional regulator [Flavobacteriales bacterium]|jgi:YebC/PmpR family DNA-binding regulatory protein|nr:YebC/PmpR family DNA-binding transcriptional regulator [Flavobacteriales bacterium]HIB76996.1 YebC/PmpR family DNA-binding transcriptional regulator [Flavobacteriales bacterium]HIN41660.1 YebC/PmpR family DNA-binding transcriptional regulator [Flavobacteriales bacterium]HIO16119.1 YebC/PmpR family DNA-binding transcriptional regulator [Flavobacteriales bacterium]HIO59428.1 YebC/PmpR family DNA-binding transcriptional regulator [Flavobacteriales bacterium]